MAYVDGFVIHVPRGKTKSARAVAAHERTVRR
jgi:uncharacterized protein YbaA (DUF1428 family)